MGARSANPGLCFAAVTAGMIFVKLIHVSLSTIRATHGVIAGRLPGKHPRPAA
jgi:hypothetical protein